MSWKQFKEKMEINSFGAGPDALAKGIAMAKQYRNHYIKHEEDKENTENAAIKVEAAAKEFAGAISKRLQPPTESPTEEEKPVNKEKTPHDSKAYLDSLNKEMLKLQAEIKEAKVRSILEMKIERPKYCRKNSM